MILNSPTSPPMKLGLRLPIGAFSDLVFECSSERVLTFDEFKRETKARYHKHELINGKPALEFLGADLTLISFKMILHEGLGVEPAEEAQRVKDLCEYGVADYLIIGGEVIGLYVIESVSEEIKFFDEYSQAQVIQLDVTFKEYVEALPA